MIKRGDYNIHILVKHYTLLTNNLYILPKRYFKKKDYSNDVLRILVNNPVKKYFIKKKLIF